MKLMYFILAIISCAIADADITDICSSNALSCKNSGRILICNLTNTSSTASVNKAINDCTSNCSLTGFELNIMIPLDGEIKLDQIADNILYLFINNRQNSSIFLTSTNYSENLRTLTLFTDNAVTGKYSIDNNSFFSHFPRIEKISISNVIFQSLPSFTHLYSLTYLHINHVYFSNNSNRSIQEEFVGGLYQLKDLQINDSSPPISRISELAFKDLSSLTSLNLDNNNIQSISENQFSYSHALSYISLKNNNLTNLYLQTFQQFPQLSSIDVSDNPLNCCSCALQWISVAIQKYDFPFIAPACQYPYNNLTATSPYVYESCPPLSLSLQCMNKSTPLCPSNLSCYNTVNSYQCSACPPGYGQVSDYRCVDLDSCSRIPAPCGDRMCVNTVDSFICLSPSNPCDIRNGGCEQKLFVQVIFSYESIVIIQYFQVSIASNERNIAKCSDQIESCKQDIKEAEERKINISEELSNLEQEVMRVMSQFEKHIEGRDDIREEVELIKSELTELTNSLNKQKYDLQDLKNEKEKLDSVMKQYKDKDKYYKDQLKKLKFDSTPPSPPTEEQLQEMIKEDLTTEVSVEEERLSVMKPNLAAIEEYRKKEEVYKKRVEEVDKVTGDRDVKKKEYDDLRNRRLTEFMAGFIQITINLKEMYQMLTLGGDAELELVDTLDPFSEGIILSIRPPRKSWKNIKNLSGGEKTLSSLALIFALHQYKPSPLYIMDEIDAALDYRNVSLLGHYIKERTKNAQFIVVSLRNYMFDLADRLVSSMLYRRYFILIPILFHLAYGLLDTGNQNIYVNIFKSAHPYKNLETAFQATSGLSKLVHSIAKQDKICEFVKQRVKDELDSLFYATSIKKLLKKCSFEISKSAEDLIAKTITNPGNDVTALYYALEIQKNLGTKDKFDSLTEILRGVNKSTVIQHSRLLKVATFLPESAADEFLSEISTIIDRADETKITRYFSEGFPATVEFLTHAFALADYVNEKPPIDPETIQKFLTEIAFHKHMETVVDSYGVLSIMSAMSHSTLYSPISARIPEEMPYLSKSNSNLDILVTDLMNNPAVTGVTVSVREYIYGDKKETVSVNMMMEYTSKGIYRISLPSLPPLGLVSFTLDIRADNTYIPTEVTVLTKVITTIEVDKLEFSIREREHTMSTTEETVRYPGTLSSQQSADHRQVIVIKLNIFNTVGEPFNPQQVFACFVQNKTSNEVFFIGQPSTTGDDHYVITIDLSAVEKESFRLISGVYDFSMIMGDVLISNPTKWNIGTIEFTFHPKPPAPEPEIYFEPLPEIHHQFKTPEPRPPAILSNIFCIVVLSPWLILLVMWPQVGANIRNLFSFGLSGMVFQISLFSIACLYCLYWWKLNMFQTLFYLSGLTLIAFLSGHRTLRNRAANRMSK
ncbi:Structural maintenance of chromosomes protein 4-like [Oopsacas minuta]|uniref:Dolichyl-diphosphooligosaccharide--protein glycosyltransferase subunit 2 n=1 Tax=Oopsacas minuta TaxID=111878 RepID=A0AAV7K5I9_9METZ|nr:Structural maintenance of chromosomes protein 4-like [Oopsacas minuta]